ncbi:MAG TPA: CapA family protein [Sedimentisphaerales bacterium]|nr:CapA family protein [Sedimentisphaerales bacterium]
MGKRTCTVLIAGDLAPIGRPEQLLVEGDVDGTFGDVLPMIRGADCCIANLECPLTTRSKHAAKAGPKMKADPRVASAMKAAGVSVVSLANNHAFDYGLDGVEETRSALDRHSIKWLGVGENAEKAKAPLFIDLDGVRLGLVVYAEHEFNWQGDDRWCTSMLEPAENVLQIQEVAGRCDALVVLIHGGPENWHYPSPRIVKICRAFARAGASAVLVAHAHAIMGSEVHQGVPIVYGLGNFLFHSSETKPLSWRLGLVARLRVGQKGVVRIEHVPILADAETGCLRLCAAEKQSAFDEFYGTLCEPLANMAHIEEQWRLFCAAQVPHLTKEILKGLMAMCPGAVTQRILPRGKPPHEASYYRKGASLLRGLTTCENHQDMLKEICEMMRLGRLARYRQKVRETELVVVPSFIE